MRRTGTRTNGNRTRTAGVTGATHVTKRGGNVFSDLGFEPEEAENLKLRSILMGELAALIRARGLTQTEAGARLGVAQPRVSDLLRGRIERFTIDALINMLGRAGVHVTLRFTERAA